MAFRILLVAVALLFAGTGATAQCCRVGESASALDARVIGDVEAAFAPSVLEYAYDDGSANVNIGPPSTFDPDMLWGNYFYTQPGAEVISEIAVAFGGTFPSLSNGPVTFWLLGDADADGDPRNATALTSAQATPDVSGNVFFRVPITPTEVGAAFFVGASAQLVGGQDRPARVDTGSRADRSWFFYAPDITATIDDLGAAPFGTRMDDPTNVPFPGAFMVRSTGDARGTRSEDTGVASRRALVGSYPNPASGTSEIRFSVDRPGYVSLMLVDALGRVAAHLIDGPLAAGNHAVNADVAELAPGVYAVVLLTDLERTVRTLAVAH